jgi:hypothetical protein
MERDLEEIAMSKPSDGKAPAGESEKAAGVDRRRFFMMGGSAVAAVAVVPLAGGEAVADDESRAERVKARYKETDHVKNYYRVNRY